MAVRQLHKSTTLTADVSGYQLKLFQRCNCPVSVSTLQGRFYFP